MKIEIKTFGYISEIIKKNIFEFENVSDTFSLKAKLEEEFPNMKKLEYKIAVNYELVNGNVKIDENSDVVLLPPFAGG